MSGYLAAFEHLRGVVLGIVDDGELDICRHREILARAIERCEALMPAPGDQPGLVSRRHGATARAAARLIAPKVGTLQWRVLDALRRAGVTGLTRDELAERLDASPNTIRPRVRELLDKELVVVVPGRWRPSAAGRRSEILVAVALPLVVVA